MGFRRSGSLPIAVLRRLPRVRARSRTGRRVRSESDATACLAAASGLDVARCTLAFDHEHYDLYLRYQSTRQAGGGMDNDSREQFHKFLLQSRSIRGWSSFAIRRRPHRRRWNVTDDPIIDVLNDGLSSVYTF